MLTRDVEVEITILFPVTRGQGRTGNDLASVLHIAFFYVVLSALSVYRRGSPLARVVLVSRRMLTLGEWKGKSKLEVLAESSCPEDDRGAIDILVASYELPDYEGYSFILFRRDGELYENNDYHCSCNGLEDWKPEKVEPEELMARPSLKGPIHDAVVSALATPAHAS